MVERSEAIDQRLVAVTWSFGQQDGLECHQAVRKKVVLPEPTGKRIRGQAAGGQRIQKRGALGLVPQRPGIANKRMIVSGHGERLRYLRRYCISSRSLVPKLLRTWLRREALIHPALEKRQTLRRPRFVARHAA